MRNSYSKLFIIIIITIIIIEITIKIHFIYIISAPSTDNLYMKIIAFTPLAHGN